jgi:uncharacterized membrane protein YeaQ/YmgE (transglycosylase-associated protein family)
MILGIIAAWLVVGVVVGYIASRVVDLHGDDPRFGFAAAAAGAVVGAVAYTLASGAAMSAWNLWSFIWAAVGAAAAVIVWHAIRSRFVSRETQTRRSSYSSTGR